MKKIYIFNNKKYNSISEIKKQISDISVNEIVCEIMKKNPDKKIHTLLFKEYCSRVMDYVR